MRVQKDLSTDAYLRYVGQVQDGIAHGWGVFTSKSGDTYNGAFERGNMRGW